MTKTTKTKKVIWSNISLNLNDWKADFLAENPDYTEDEMYALMEEINRVYLDDERANLNIPLSTPIIIIADIGRWNGRVLGYKKIAPNISDCLYSDTDYAEWYVDELGDLRCTAIHHDGTNYYLYRQFKEDLSDTQINNFIEKIFYDTVTRADINRYTKRLGDYISEVYGW